MFTGIVEEVGTISGLVENETGARVAIACSWVLRDATAGDSIAVNGVCLTAIVVGTGQWSADLSPETLQRTNLGDLRAGSAVNLERPLRADGRLNGHFVLGHVDGVAEVLSLSALGDDNWWLSVRVPPALGRYIVEKGSVALDGISLTVARISQDQVDFALIPHTFAHTALPFRTPGSRLNVEVDILAKHLEKLTTPHSP